MTDSFEPRSLGEIGLASYSPYLMNRIMGRYNASLRAEIARLGLTTPKMRALAVLSVIDRPLIRELAVYAVVEQSTLSRALDGLAAEGLVRREADAQDSRGTRVIITDEGRSAFDRLWPRMAEGLVRREADAQDSRGTRVSITDNGRAAFDRLWPHMAAAQTRMFHGIPDEERQAFVAVLQKVLANIRKHEF